MGLVGRDSWRALIFSGLMEPTKNDQGSAGASPHQPGASNLQPTGFHAQPLVAVSRASRNHFVGGWDALFCHSSLAITRKCASLSQSAKERPEKRSTAWGLATTNEIRPCPEFSRF